MRKNGKAYIVGGAIREALMGKLSSDIDVVFCSYSIPLSFASEIGGKVVVLGKERKTFKVLKYPFTFDFTPLNGHTLIGDLLSRDFTINSIALNLESERIFDPLDGLRDIEEGVIKVASPHAFDYDSLRLLRAFRFRSSLGFKIHEGTRRIVKRKILNFSPWKASPRERIAEEWKKLLLGDYFYLAVKDMLDLGYLERFFLAFKLMRGMPQGDYHHLDVLNHSIKTLEAMEDLLCAPPSWIDRSYLESKVGFFRRRDLLRIAALLHDVGKPFCFRVKDGEVMFKGHQFIGSKIARGYSRALLLGSREIDYISKLVYNHMMPLFFLKREGAGRPWERSLLSWLMKVGEDALSLLLLSIADLRATRGKKVSDEERRSLFEIGERIRYYLDDVLRVKPLLSGKDIMAVTGLREGKEIGIIKDRIVYLQRMGKLKTKDEALRRILGII
ncbi:MAG: HD domain-containing protein [Synergistetes bacterium]|nr:HD domain-containing protein [Synergistota bacterium]